MNISRLMRGTLISAILALTPLAVANAGNIPGTTCPLFPADSWWHADVSKLKVHPSSSLWMSNMQPYRMLHPDLGSSYGELKGPYGIPVTVVSGTHTKVSVKFDYPDESDKRGYPFGSDSKVEGWSFSADADRHVIMVDKTNCYLYETYYTRKASGKWLAYSGAFWNLKSNTLRPANWTSADAAGLPILPGLLRYSEVKAGKVDHAIRFTTNISNRKYLWPARHQAGSQTSNAYPPMGARFRLKKSYVIKSSLQPETKTVLNAMKKYGLVLADNGSPWYFTGAADNGFSEKFVNEMKQVPASAFEAVDTYPLKISTGSMKVKQ